VRARAYVRVYERMVIDKYVYVMIYVYTKSHGHYTWKYVDRTIQALSLLL